MTTFCISTSGEAVQVWVSPPPLCQGTPPPPALLMLLGLLGGSNPGCWALERGYIFVINIIILIKTKHPIIKSTEAGLSLARWRSAHHSCREENETLFAQSRVNNTVGGGSGVAGEHGRRADGAHTAMHIRLSSSVSNRPSRSSERGGATPNTVIKDSLAAKIPPRPPHPGPPPSSTTWGLCWALLCH